MMNVSTWIEYCKKAQFMIRQNRSGVPTKLYGGDDARFWGNIEQALKDAKLFFVDPDTVRLLLLTKCPDKNSQIKMPFPTMFVDTKLSREEAKFFGIDLEFDIEGFIIQEGVLQNQKTQEVCGKNIRIIPCLSDGEYIQFSTLTISYDVDAGTLVEERYVSSNMKEFLREYAMNLINLMNDPEVSIIRRPEDAGRNQKRMKRGKIPIPESLIVRITGERKHYIDQLIKSDSIRTFGYEFWVKGHWRNLTAERYKEKKRIWVLPHKRGKGELVEKLYHVKKA